MARYFLEKSESCPRFTIVLRAVLTQAVSALDFCRTHRVVLARRVELRDLDAVGQLLARHVLAVGVSTTMASICFCSSAAIARASVV